jgi:hypothetical protein
MGLFYQPVIRHSHFIFAVFLVLSYVLVFSAYSHAEALQQAITAKNGAVKVYRDRRCR